MLRYTLDEQQAKFTMGIDNWVNGYCASSLYSIIVIMYQGSPAGFFVLDRGTDRMNLTDNESSVLLRSFSVNPVFQGKGIGQWAMCSVDRYIKKYMTGVDEIVLSVNVQNEKAYRLYVASGFTDEGKIIHGIIGAQNVLSKRI